jgi:1-acyl-sn-glycerol-3-phosphate acyltransferase
LSLIVFPEGTRSPDGRVARFKGGSFYLALEAGLPIVPLSVVGSRHVMRKGRLATYPGDVTLVVHEPIDTSGLSGTDAKAFGERVRQVLKPDAEADVADAVPSRT